jgi:hypothetical protein
LAWEEDANPPLEPSTEFQRKTRFSGLRENTMEQSTTDLYLNITINLLKISLYFCSRLVFRPYEAYFEYCWLNNYKINQKKNYIH